MMPRGVQEAQSLVRDEALAALKDLELAPPPPPAGGAGVEDPTMRRLPLAKAAVTEALRLFPVAPVVGRILGADATLGGFAVPAGTNVMMSYVTMVRRKFTSTR